MDSLNAKSEPSRPHWVQIKTPTKPSKTFCWISNWPQHAFSVLDPSKRLFQCPGEPSQPVDMESVRNYFLSHRQSQKTYFDRAHGTCGLNKLGPGQEVLLQVTGWGWMPAWDHCWTSYHAMQLHRGGPRQKVLQNKGTCVAYPPQHSQSCTAPTTTPTAKPFNHTLFKPLRLIQPHLLKTSFNTYPPQTPSPAIILYLRNSECPQYLCQHQPHLSHRWMP